MLHRASQPAQGGIAAIVSLVTSPSALIVFFGAEFAYIYAHEYGFRVAHLEEVSVVPS